MTIKAGMPEQNIIKMTPRPTRYAVSHAHDIVSTFYLFITPAIERIILEMTNLEGFHKYGDSWKKMDETDLQAYLGLLILAGVYRSRGEAATSLWDAESGRPIFRATMPLKLFHTYSRLIPFDDRESKPARRVTDKLAAIREVWDNVVLLSTLHTDGDVSDGEYRKSVIILDYNHNKGGVDNLDKREINPTWMSRKQNKRRVFLEQLGKALVIPLIERRKQVPRTEASAAVVKAIQSAWSS
ncbi:uncharacterized protein LOC133662903 [Entelurus aequoreus]|uniref:uncharacterized protein LOC133662903 n=1 Tax=Entelurus aequoreus TaxID=161455 RepID=UPI002B1DB730|nr:uncharacterized protein LOC133662903 [Entelurus aequoreus]